MGKPRYRQTKIEVGKILMYDNRERAFEALGDIPGDVLAGPLFSYLYSMDDRFRFRSTAAMGALVRRLAERRLEDARVILRRLMWNLNDESGGIGWGSAEAMGEILKRHRTLAEEFGAILFSYIDPKGNFLEHEVLQRGALWGVGTYMTVCSDADQYVIEAILPFLASDDPVKRGYAVRALVNLDEKNTALLPSRIMSDERMIPVFDGWRLFDTSIAALTKPLKSF